MKELFGGFFKNTGAKKVWPYFLVIGLGAVLMCLGGYTETRSKSAGSGEPNMAEVLPVTGESYEDSGFSEYCEKLEYKLSEALSKVQGAGRVQVILTLRSGGKTELAVDTTYESLRTADSGGDITGNLTNITEKRETKHVLAAHKDGGTAPVITMRPEPLAEGALIIAEGGDNTEIRASLTKAASALLDLPTHKIEVLKMGKQ